MSKYTLECPRCGSINTVSNFLFAKKNIRCGTCNEEINIKDSKLTSKACPHCNAVFVYDQTKRKTSKCPSCKKEISISEVATVKYKMITIKCPKCTCSIEVDKTAKTHVCPICDYAIDIQKEIAIAAQSKSSSISTIQFEGDSSTLVWKHPIENFNMGSQLIVHESQEATFFLNGEALDTFGAGRYTLTTENVPFLKKLYNISDKEPLPFHATVYFVNKTVQMGMKWGTDSRVRFIDPETNIPLDIGASGEFNFTVSDSRKLLTKLIGTSSKLERNALSSDKESNNQTLKGLFRALLSTEIKSYLANSIKQNRINILEIDQHLSSLSNAIRDLISPKFEEFGIKISHFYITTVLLPEDDKNFQEMKALISKSYLGVKSAEIGKKVAEAEGDLALAEEEIEAKRKIAKARAEAEIKKIQAQANAEELRQIGIAEAEAMHAKGYTGKDELDAEVQKEYAKGMGQMGSNGAPASSVAGDLIGTMVNLKMAENAVDKMGAFFDNDKTDSIKPKAPSTENWQCTCGEENNIGKFCMNCGKPRNLVWTCPNCGTQGNKGKFCSECGQAKP